MVRPRYASTVVLVRRDGNGSFEVLLTRRPVGKRFLGGFYVFPGGTVHEDDYSLEVLKRCRGLSGADAHKLLDACHTTEVASCRWVTVVCHVVEDGGSVLLR